MHGKVIVMTGATSGIGEAAAVALAEMGARLVLVARNPERGRATLERLERANPGAAHAVYHADLSLMAETRRAAAEIADREPPIDVLANNAGALFVRRAVTEEGLERTFALNHMSYFGMTQGLRHRLAAGARIVITASAAHRGARFSMENLQSERYRGFDVYSRSKLANILFTREAARSFDGTGITVNCFHPGVVASRFFDGKPGALGFFLRLIKPFMISSRKGAETLVYLATSAAVAGVTGQYFARRRPARITAEAANDASARALWDESARLYASG